MPGKLKAKIVAGRHLPVMDRASDLTDAFVEVSEACRSRLLVCFTETIYTCDNIHFTLGFSVVCISLLLKEASCLLSFISQVKFGNTTFKTDVCPKSLNPQWNSEWFKFEVKGL